MSQRITHGHGSSSSGVVVIYNSGRLGCNAIHYSAGLAPPSLPRRTRSTKPQHSTAGSSSQRQQRQRRRARCCPHTTPHAPTTPPQRKAATASFAHRPAPLPCPASPFVPLSSLSRTSSSTPLHSTPHTQTPTHPPTHLAGRGRGAPHPPGLDDYCAQHRDDRLLAAPLLPHRRRRRERAAPGRRHQAPRGRRRQRRRHRRAQLRSRASLPLGAVPRHPGTSVRPPARCCTALHIVLHSHHAHGSRLNERRARVYFPIIWP